jgi:Sensors of blue-light using FAD
MLIRIIYVSTAVGAQTVSETKAILEVSQKWNHANDVTGVLCEGEGVYLQCLEGERRLVTQLYARIYADPRHSDVQMIHCESVTNRRYRNWSMGHVDLAQVDPVRQVNWSEFDPYSSAGMAALARIDEILTNSVTTANEGKSTPQISI